MAKKALIDFHYGMLPEGLTPGKYPSVYLQVLSTFSLHYIMMAWEYYRETGDRETARFCLTDADRVLDYYDSHRDETGLVAGLEYWAFVDWLTAWNQSAGMPEAVLHGPSTIINLMYAYALDCAQKLANELGRTGLAIEYADRRREILGLVEETCWSTTNGMYREGPAFEQYTCHAQAWAVLCGLKTGDDAEKLLTLAAGGTNVHKCTFSTSYEWFRALETAGMYSEMRIALKEWVNLIDLECTCCPETPVDARSDCHAWSALPMYEMVRTMAGVRSEGIAWESVIIEPHLMGLEDIRGVVATPRGDIGFDYSDGHRILDIPDNMQVFYIHADGKREKLHVGKNDINI